MTAERHGPLPWWRRAARGAVLLPLVLIACGVQGERPGAEAPAAAPAATAAGDETAADPATAPPECTLVEEGFGPEGSVEIRVEEVARGLEVPWGIAFLPAGGLLVTERPGRVRLIEEGRLLPTPVATLETANTAEGGLLGIALHPEFATNRLFFLYLTVAGPSNRIELWRLAEDSRSARRQGVVFSGIPAARFHDGGRLRIGPDGMLYASTGDAGRPRLSQDPQSPAGKLLRLALDGSIPADNPHPGSPAWITGIRNSQGFDWPAPDTIWLTDHGPSGERGRRGHDEVSVARRGDDLGWPAIYGCETAEGMRAPSLTWRRAAPPGGAAIYTGDAIPEWRGDLLVGTLGSRHLHRVVLDETGRVRRHEVYLSGADGHGRLREVVMGPDGELYVTTSNCDGRGTCPPEGDVILRVTR